MSRDQAGGKSIAMVTVENAARTACDRPDEDSDAISSRITQESNNDVVPSV
jgi:hypothetical protein